MARRFDLLALFPLMVLGCSPAGEDDDGDTSPPEESETPTPPANASSNPPETESAPPDTPTPPQGQSLSCDEVVLDPTYAASIGLYPDQCGGGPLLDVDLCGPPQAPCQILSQVEIATHYAGMPAPRGRVDEDDHSRLLGSQNPLGSVLVQTDGTSAVVYPSPSDGWPLSLGEVFGEATTVVASSSWTSTASYLWVHDPQEGWSCGPGFDLPPYGGTVSDLRRDAAGCQYGAVISQDQWFTARFDGEWVLEPITHPSINYAETTGSAMYVALGPQGEPSHLFQIGLGLYWQGGSAAAEGPINATLPATSAAMVVGPGGEEGIPRVLVAHQLNPQEGTLASAVSLLSRIGGAWEVEPLVELDTAQAEPCDGEGAEGDTCELNRSTYTTIGIVSNSSGDLRAFFAEIHETGTLTMTCSGLRSEPSGSRAPVPSPPPPECSWEGPITTESHLWMSWLEGRDANPPVHLGKIADSDLSGGSAEVDSEGDVHLVFLVSRPEVDANNPLTMVSLELGYRPSAL